MINNNLSQEEFFINQEGIALVVSIIVLFLLSLFGIWGLTRSTLELQISGNQQRYDENFNVSEGGANIEATYVGFSVRSEYKITDPSNLNNDLTVGNFDDISTWPVDKLISTSSDSRYIYSYFVTYLYPDAPPKGYDPSMFSGYKFRISGYHRSLIELGGMKIGVQSIMF